MARALGSEGRERESQVHHICVVYVRGNGRAFASKGGLNVCPFLGQPQPTMLGVTVGLDTEIKQDTIGAPHRAHTLHKKADKEQ